MKKLWVCAVLSLVFAGCQSERDSQLYQDLVYGVKVRIAAKKPIYALGAKKESVEISSSKSGDSFDYVLHLNEERSTDSYYAVELVKEDAFKNDDSRVIFYIPKKSLSGVNTDRAFNVTIQSKSADRYGFQIRKVRFTREEIAIRRVESQNLLYREIKEVFGRFEDTYERYEASILTPQSQKSLVNVSALKERRVSSRTVESYKEEVVLRKPF